MSFRVPDKSGLIVQQRLADLGGGLTWLPDETLFSFVSRHHALSGALHPWITCDRFFGHRRRGSAHDFPSRIDEFAARTGFAFGDGEQLVLRGTLIPFFLPWRDPRLGHQTIAALRGDRIGMLKFALGLLTSRFGAQHPLKACEICIAQDRREFGVAYWHRAHQWPGVWICPCHAIPLLASSQKRNGHYRYAFVLPRTIELERAESAWRIKTASTDELMTRLSRLAVMVLGASALAPGAVNDPSVLATTYRRRMVEIGWLRTAERLDWPALAQNLRGHLDTVACLPEFARLRASRDALRTHLSLLLYGRSQSHPLRHLLLIAALFPDWNAFLTNHIQVGSECSSIEYEESPSAVKEASVSSEKPHVAADVSARELARRYQVDVHTAMAWRASAGLAAVRRPKILKPTVLQQVIASLREGKPKAEVAVTAGISVTSVTRILRTEPGLQASWHQQRAEETQKGHREVWSGLLRHQPGSVLRLLRLQASATYAWLYRNDRQWLEAQMRSRPHRASTGNNVLSRWRGKDEYLAGEIRRASLWLSGKGAFGLGELRQAVPELSNYLCRMDRLPLTQRVLLSVLQHAPGPKLPSS